MARLACLEGFLFLFFSGVSASFIQIWSRMGAHSQRLNMDFEEGLYWDLINIINYPFLAACCLLLKGHKQPFPLGGFPEAPCPSFCSLRLQCLPVPHILPAPSTRVRASLILTAEHSRSLWRPGTSHTVSTQLHLEESLSFVGVLDMFTATRRSNRLGNLQTTGTCLTPSSGGEGAWENGASEGLRAKNVKMLTEGLKSRVSLGAWESSQDTCWRSWLWPHQ